MREFSRETSDLEKLSEFRNRFWHTSKKKRRKNSSIGLSVLNAKSHQHGEIARNSANHPHLFFFSSPSVFLSWYILLRLLSLHALFFSVIGGSSNNGKRFGYRYLAFPFFSPATIFSPLVIRTPLHTKKDFSDCFVTATADTVPSCVFFFHISFLLQTHSLGAASWHCFIRFYITTL